MSVTTVPAIIKRLKATPIIHYIVHIVHSKHLLGWCASAWLFMSCHQSNFLCWCPQPGPNTFWYCQVTIIFSSPQQLLHLVQSFPLCNCSNPNSDPECLMVWEVFTCMIYMSIQVQDLFLRSNLLLNYCEISRIKLYASLLFYIEMRCRTWSR